MRIILRRNLNVVMLAVFIKYGQRVF